MARIELQESPHEVRVHIEGTLGTASYEAFDRALRAIEPSGRSLVLDLSQALSIDSCGVGMLLLAREIAHAGRVRIAGASEGIRAVLATVNFTQLFEIE